MRHFAIVIHNAIVALTGCCRKTTNEECCKDGKICCAGEKCCAGDTKAS